MNWQQGIPGNEWDNKLFTNGGHFLQSSHWAAVQSALGRRVFFGQGDGWQCVAVVEKGKLASRLYAPYGPFITKPGAFTAALTALSSLAKTEGVAFVRIEPTGKIQLADLQKNRLVRAPKQVQPEFTWVKNLTRPTDELLAEMTPTNRNLYRTAANKNLSFAHSTTIGDLQLFLDMIHEVAAATGMKPHSDNYFQTVAATLFGRGAAHLYIASHMGVPVASALVYDTPTTRYYAHAGSYSSARKLHPGSPLLTTMIFDAKTAGQKEFDFFGIAPPNQPNHRWAGFTRFKRSFGGEIKPYCGTWEKPVKPLAYTVYRTIHAASKMTRSS